ncbi:MAG: PASTA domain-containing protein [Odoribacter sp.]
MKKLSAKTKFILLNLAVALILLSGISVYVLSRLDNYTQHGHFISVPAFYDLMPAEALELAERYKLRAEIIDSLYDEEARPGSVLEQNPSIGSSVKENRLIHLTINARNPEKVIFPNLQNAAYRQTLQTLEARGFKIGKIIYVPSEFQNLVINLQHDNEIIIPGTPLPKGSTIDILLGSGNGNNTLSIPLFTGKNIQQAIDIARKYYLNIGEIIPDGSIRTKNEKYAATIYKQEPATNQIAPAGTPVNLYITLQKDKIEALDTLLVSGHTSPDPIEE